MSVTKKFDKKLFDANDPKARELAIKFFKKSQGFAAKPNPDKYGVDLLLFKEDKHVAFAECEIKRVWKGKDFPYGSVQFPERKAKYVYQNNLPVVFIMFNADCNRALLVNGQDLLKSKLVQVPNVYVKSEECFFQVPLDKVTFIDIETTAAFAARLREVTGAGFEDIRKAIEKCGEDYDLCYEHLTRTGLACVMKDEVRYPLWYERQNKNKGE
jgi:hypothetical protein